MMVSTNDKHQSVSDPATGKDAFKALIVRAGIILALFNFELWVLRNAYRPFESAPGDSVFLAVNEATKLLVFALVNPVSIVSFAFLFRERAHAFAEQWTALSGARVWAGYIFANVTLLLPLLIATEPLNAAVAAGQFPWLAFALWCIGVALACLLLAFALAPLKVWTAFFSQNARLIVIALVIGTIAMQISLHLQRLWDVLARWTLTAAGALLQLYEREVSFDVAQQMLTVNDFSVLITAECSGYEGMGLVASTLLLFIFAFRRDLKFPNVWILIPIGVTASLILNVVRIAALASIGAHISPTLAFDGFHSHAGWIAFLAISVGLMYAAYRMAFFSKHQPVARQNTSRATDRHETTRVAYAYLLPFAVLLISSIGVRAVAEAPHALYPVVLATVCLAMWPFRDVYRRVFHRPQLVALALGAAIGAAWIATEPQTDGPSLLADWIGAQPTWIVTAWLICRVFGFALIVPIVEELAFRGYLHSAIASRGEAPTSEVKFSWLAFMVTTALFGALHDRWLLGAIAGALFALAMYRSGRVSDAIFAHIVANAIIAAWALFTKSWALL